MAGLGANGGGGGGEGVGGGNASGQPMAARYTLSLRTTDRMGILRDLSLTLLANRIDFDTLSASAVEGVGLPGPEFRIEATVLADPARCGSQAGPDCLPPATSSTTL